MGHLSQTPYQDAAATLCPGLGHGLADGDSLVAPLVQSTTFGRDRVGSTAQHQYSRVSNPTVATLEEALGHLEQALPATCFASGMAAESALFLGLLKAGDHVVCGQSVYGGTTRLLQQVLCDLGVESTFVDATNLQAVAQAIRATTRLIFIETPSNPTLEITDIAGCAHVAHEAGALLAVDNTFMTPLLQRPLDLGADISVYSTTKFIEGHSVAMGGALLTRNQTLQDRFYFLRKCTGAIQTPFNAWLTINGLRTLPLRLRHQAETAEQVAQQLADQPGIKQVYYPTLGTTASRELAQAQHEGAHGAVVTFEIDGSIETGRRFVESLRLCTLVEHVGSTQTLITHPATMTHADVPTEQRAAVGISDTLLRLSVGLEPAEAILNDILQALASAVEFESVAREAGGQGEGQPCHSAR
ncbi:MAG: aminotransferase class I/II-fold pyridoxal phosphate-dependent enzyme [Planctomycetes bacterium]|nr:aminotransferase class I/II-fold pyridoxal phosphate-dependent enzyme [Planctomycetota bacterium]NOG54724.1 aminotransferase class I/II-fold pyridoxal phosphate-dependent enzyme [Planctomycetota bacterium]